MPAPYLPARPYPGTYKPYTLGEAAAEGKLIVYRCLHCHRLVRFLASDLAAMFGADRAAFEPLFDCSRCGLGRYIRVMAHAPEPGEYGQLVIRRPGRVKTVQTWYTVTLGS